MALSVPLTISETLNALVENLQTWVGQYSGKATQVSNLKDLWETPSLNSQSPRVLVCFNSEQARGSFEDLAAWHRVDRTFQVAVTKGRGYLANRGDSLSNPDAVELPFLDALEEVRDQLRCMLGISEEMPSIDYKNMRMSNMMGNLVVDSAIIEFSVAADIPFIGTQPQNAAT